MFEIESFDSNVLPQIILFASINEMMETRDRDCIFKHAASNVKDGKSVLSVEHKETDNSIN